MNDPKLPRYVYALAGYSAIAISVSGLLGIGILFGHYARHASNWVCYAVILGYIAFLGGAIFGMPSPNTKKPRGSQSLLGPTLLYVVASIALILGVSVPTTFGDASNWTEHSLVLGLLLVMAGALSGTITAASVGWRQWRDAKAFKR